MCGERRCWFLREFAIMWYSVRVVGVSQAAMCKSQSKEGEEEMKVGKVQQLIELDNEMMLVVGIPWQFGIPLPLHS